MAGCLQDLALEPDFTDIEAIAQQMCERSAREGNSADHLGLQCAPLGNDASLSQVGKQQIEAAQVQVALENRADGLGLLSLIVICRSLLS